MATYTVRAGDTWFSLASKLGVDARTLKQQNRGTTLARGVVIRTGGARYTRPADINPWGLPAGQVPSYAVGTTAANKYLASIGQPTAAPTEVTPTEELPGVTPSGVGVYDPETGQRYRTPEDIPTPVEGFTSMEALARQTGLYTPPAAVARGGRQPSAVPYEVAGIPPTTDVYIPPPRPDIPEGALPGQYIGGAPGGFGPTQTALGMGMYGGVATALGGLQGPSEQIVMGRGSAWYQPPESQATGLAQVPGRIAERFREVFGTGGPVQERFGMGEPVVEVGVSGEPETIYRTISPIAPGSPQATAIAARWTGQAIAEYGRTGNRNFLPNVITTAVALHLTGWLETAEGEDILTVNNLFNTDNLSYTEIEPGVWAKNPEVTYTGGYTGAVGYTGRRYTRGRGARGGGYVAPAKTGGIQYGPRLVQWRIAGFG